MWRWLALALALLPSVALAQSAIRTFPPGSFQSRAPLDVAAGGGGYTGPNDVVTGALACWGLQACSLAVAGTKVANICNSGDANCADVNSLSNGNFDVATATGAPLNCGSTGGTCTVKKLYDKSGQTNCNSLACDLSNATIANRPTLAFSCTGLGASQPCLHFNGTSQELDDGTGGVTITQAQPYTVVAIVNAASVAAQVAFIAQHSGGSGLFSVFTTTPTLEYQSGATFSSTAVSASTWYVTQGVMNGASSTTYLNGTSNTGNAGTNGLSGIAGNQLVVGNDGFSQFWNGNAVMWGIWPVGFNGTQAGSMNTNQRGNWGF